MTTGQRKGHVRPPMTVSAGAGVVRLRAAVGPVDGVRTDVVNALRTAIESGRYRVEPVEVATSFLRDVLGQLVA